MLAVLLLALAFSGCRADDPADKEENPVDSEVTDLQLALLNNLMYQKPLEELEGKSIEGHEELIDEKFKKNISGGETLVAQLRGYKLVEYQHGNSSGFKAAIFSKGESIVVVYCGTEDGKDWIEDINAGAIDYSQQDPYAKNFAKKYARAYPNHNLYITGYSMGGRLCYLGTETVCDDRLDGNLKKVRTFNGLGVKEFIDFSDGNLSNIHSLQTKFADKTFNYIVEGDPVSDGINYPIGYMHIGSDFKVPCTNNTDDGLMKQHDLYSIIDYLLNNPPPAENTSSVVNMDGKAVLVLTDQGHNLGGEIVYANGDIDVSTWNTFVSKYPKVADPMSQGKDYFNKMHITLFYLKDNEGNVLDNRGFMNATGFGNDPVGWKDKYGDFDWMNTDPSESNEVETFYILYEGGYYVGPASCHVVNAKLREYVTLGTFEQDGVEDNGKEPVEWLVLAQEDDKMLVVSKYCLDYLPYPDDWSSNIVWESCSLRQYLNNDFVSLAFSDEEQKNILTTENKNTADPDIYSTVDGNPTQDRVFLLSIAEAKKYLPAATASVSSLYAYGTDYLYNKLQNHPAGSRSGEPLTWALRADVDTAKNEQGFGRPREVVVQKSTIACMISTGGMRDPDGPLSVVRPAMWISSSVPKNGIAGQTTGADNSEPKPEITEAAETTEPAGRNWSELYYHLIADNNNEIQTNNKYDTTIYVTGDMPLALHDFDMNGVPELIFGLKGARMGLAVFTVYNGKVQYAGEIGGKSSFYSDDASHHGIFRGDSWGTQQVLVYTALADGKLVSRDVLSGKLNQALKKFDYSVLDDTLYQVYLDCTAADTDEISIARTPENQLQLYDWRDIESNGWDSFVKHYGYSS